MKRKIKVLYVTAEIAPYANSGGMAEVARSFPKALMATGDYEVRRVMPLYKNMDVRVKYKMDFPVPMEYGYDTCVLKTASDKNELPTYFIGNERYYYRENIYGYEDDNVRFFFFCKAVIEMLKRINYTPDIIHTNDWHTGFLPLLIKKEFPNIKSVYTIHNIAYHGYIPSTYLNDLLTDREKVLLGYPEWLDFAKAGILYSDLLTTVSPAYAKEIMSSSYGDGMSKLIESRKNGMVGILNGIDDEIYNPIRVGEVPFPYDNNSLSEKKKNREVLRKNYGLSNEDIPLVAMITRLDFSKGIELLIKTIADYGIPNYQLVLLGSGNCYYQGLLANIASEYPGTFTVDFEYTEEKAKLIYAGADIYLMPSQNEPCGLGQLYAMKYGTVPVVHPVGGLKDTVLVEKEHPEKSTGFYMSEWNSEALKEALQLAISTYTTKDWDQYRQNCMQYDSSWKSGLAEYQKYYQMLLEN